MFQVSNPWRRPDATLAPGLNQEAIYLFTAATPPPPLHSQSSFSAFDSVGASGVFGSPVDLPEGSWQNPVDLSESSQQNPFDLTEDDGGPVTDPNKGVCIGKLMGTQFTVWARVIGRNRVGFRADCTDENGQFVDDIALWPEFTIVADERIERWDVWRDGTDADIRARLRAMLGYPQFSALVGAHPAFSVSRRFSIVRARLLFFKQHKVETLEKQLEELDLQEQRPLHLGSFGADTNILRIQVLKKLDRALADYDELVKRNVEMLQLPHPPKRSVDSLLNWVNATGSITRKETAFLHSRDLCAVGGREQNGIMWMESLVERIFIYFHQSFIQERFFRLFQCQPPASTATQNSKRFFLLEDLTQCIITHVCITTLIVLLMQIPMVAIPAASSSGTLQMICITLMSTLFTFIMSGPMKIRTAEIFSASTTYATL
ncbi:hypothetical protein MMC10_011352, partial [Thelotrema lepadinum]|nr:hypothetical protein [Thelotrema lepadinum]